MCQGRTRYECNSFIPELTGLDLLQVIWISLLSYNLGSMKEVIVKISLTKVCFGERGNMIIVVAEILDKNQPSF